MTELDSLRAELARLAQKCNLLTIRVEKQHRLLKYWHQRFRWCASYSGKLQERERDLTQRLEREREFND